MTGGIALDRTEVLSLRHPDRLRKQKETVGKNSGCLEAVPMQSCFQTRTTTITHGHYLDHQPKFNLGDD